MPGTEASNAIDAIRGHYLFPGQWFRRHPLSFIEDVDTEVQQSRVRLTIAILLVSYLLVTASLKGGGLMQERWVQPLLLCYALYALAVSTLWLIALKYPGHYPIRRLSRITLDSGVTAFSIIVHPWTMMPTYVLLLWVVLGNGMRYGHGYLIVATLVAQIALVAIYILSPFTTVAVYMAATLSLTAIAVPYYAWLLLERVSREREAAQTASLSKSRFLAQASHDLRQPLHATSLFIGSLREKGLTTEQSVVVDRMERSLRGVTDLFRALLDVSMLDSGKIEPKFEVVALGPLLSEVAQQCQPATSWAPIDLRIISTDRHVWSDRTLLTSMVQNLLSNAIKYGEGRSVVVGTRLRDGKIALEVWDQGPGIAPEHLSRVFDEFFQIRAMGAPDVGGVGLGLSIVSRLSALMGLSAQICSQLGKGTRVSIEGLLPMAPASTPTTSVIEELQALMQPLAGCRVLLLEDDRDVLYVAAELLENWGCSVEASPTLPEEIGSGYDILLTDFDLGHGVTGADCITAFREACGADAPVVVMTGHDIVPIQDLVSPGTATIVKKPIHPAELRSVVSTAMMYRTHKPETGEENFA